MSNAVSLDLLGENDTSKMYLVDSQSLGQKHCLSITKLCKSKIDIYKIRSIAIILQDVSHGWG